MTAYRYDGQLRNVPANTVLINYSTKEGFI